MPSQGSSQIDWRKLSAIDVNNFKEQLQSDHFSVAEISSMIAFSSIDSEFDLQSIDTNFVKLFKLSQIVISFLLEKYYYQYEHLKEQVDKVKDIVEENRKLRRLLQVYKQAFTFGRSFRRTIAANSDKMDYDASTDRYQCPDCPKAFGNSLYLQSHIYRRHPENSILSRGLMPLTQKINQYQSALLPSAAVDDVKKELASLKDQLKKTEEQLVEEKESRIALQDRLDLELEDKIKHLTMLLKENKHLENSEQLGQHSNDKANVAELSTRDASVTSEGTNKVIEMSQQSPIKLVSSNNEETQDLTGLLLVHTQEVRNLGNRLEKLVDKLWSNDSPLVSENVFRKNSEPAQQQASLFPNKSKSHFQSVANTEINLDAKNRDIDTDATHDRDDDEDEMNSGYPKNQGDQVLSYLDRYMEALGIENKENIGSDEFVSAMKVIKERRKRIGYQDKVNSLKNNLDYEIRTRKIGKTLEQLNKESLKKLTTTNKSKSPWLIARRNLDETSSKYQEKQNRVRFGGITIKELDKSKPDIKLEKAGKRLWKTPKSVLIKRDAQGNRIDTNEVKMKRRISFSDTRIEISPEYSSDDDDFDQMMSGDVQTGTIEIPEKTIEKLQSAENRESNRTGSDQSRSLKSSFTYLKPTQQQYDPVPPIPKPRLSKALTLGDQLSTADLKWFDSDGSDEFDDHNDNQNATSITFKPKNINNDHTKMKANFNLDDDEMSPIDNGNGKAEQRISVNELTKIIEDQLHNRQATSKTNLINSVDAVTGKGKNSNSNTGYGVKAIGTLNYDSDSD